MGNNGREIIAKNVAKMLKPGSVINLGIGLPSLVANYIPEDKDIFLQSENGILGMGPAPSDDEVDPDLVNAGGKPVTIRPGGACFDHALSFTMIRGGHIDACVLGALEVDEEGNIANWIIPGKLVPGMGGAMDLVVGAKRVIVAMEHTTKDGKPKILKKCTLPLTAQKEVDIIVTNMAVIEVSKDGLILKEILPGLNVKDVQDVTEPKLIVDKDLKPMIV